ncbi:unnamed protein product [Rangifer tarandus platyrhynchus]|uniref:Basic proline-rich protein-like n=1 Tax=Rangifer tarandus platyrhynchus TaxID=3082113 RepID=A0ABN8Y8Q1_RANTA|nr:unnamed protein product [Rangifer tarandus platyrhynchus]
MRVAPWSPPLGGLARQGLPPWLPPPKPSPGLPEHPAAMGLRRVGPLLAPQPGPRLPFHRCGCADCPAPRLCSGGGCATAAAPLFSRLFPQPEARSTPCSNGTTRRPRYPGAQRPLGSRDRNGSARAPPHVARATHPHPFLPAGPARRVARDAAGRPTPGMLRARGGALRGGAKLAAPGVPRAAGRG